jgi:chemotaxis protein CheX
MRKRFLLQASQVTMMIEFGQDEMVQLTRQIWESMLNIDLTFDGAPQQYGERTLQSVPGSREPFVGGCVQITGAWDGGVRVDCSASLAQRAAAAFFGTESGKVSLEQVRDAVGELANMSAGSIKPLLPRPCHIALPSVVDGSNFELTIRNSQVVLSSRFVSQGQTLLVTIFEASPRIA